MNNISVLASSEKDTLLAFKDNSLENNEEDSGADFLSQLHAAHSFIEPLQKGNKNLNAENSIATLKNEEPGEGTDTPKTLDEKPVGEVIVVSGDSMLAQISSAQAINISVSKPAEKVDGATFEMNSSTYQVGVSTHEVNRSIHEVSSSTYGVGVSTHEINSSTDKIDGATDEIDGATDEIDFKKTSATDSFKADIAIEKSVSKVVPESKNIPSIDSSVAASPAAITQITERDKSTAVDTLMTKDTDLIKADKILASLTPEQRLQLSVQTQSLDKPSNVNNVAALKQLLTQFITNNEEVQSSVTKQSFSSEISTLDTAEKQTLLTQLNAYIKSEQPKGEQLAVLKQTVSELKTSIEIEFVDATKAKATTSVASETPDTVYNPQKLNLKLPTNEDADLNKASIVSTKRDDLLKSPEELQKDGFKKITPEETSARVAQVFTKITAAISTEQPSSLSYYNSLDYDSSLLDTQILQAQQLQSTSQVKQLSIEPAVMQAINIVKSDAAKLLQERVSSMLSINNKEAEIRLDPPEMGSMQIRIRSDAEQAHINFVVQNQQAKEALEQSMPRLREMLAQQGLELGESTISYGQSGGESSEQGENRAQGNMANNKAVNDDDQELADNIAQSSRKQTSSSIDYYA